MQLCLYQNIFRDSSLDGMIIFKWILNGMEMKWLYYYG